MTFPVAREAAGLRIVGAVSLSIYPAAPKILSCQTRGDFLEGNILAAVRVLPQPVQKTEAHATIACGLEEGEHEARIEDRTSTIGFTGLENSCRTLQC